MEVQVLARVEAEEETKEKPHLFLSWRPFGWPAPNSDGIVTFTHFPHVSLAKQVTRSNLGKEVYSSVRLARGKGLVRNSENTLTIIRPITVAIQLLLRVQYQNGDLHKVSG